MSQSDSEQVRLTLFMVKGWWVPMARAILVPVIGLVRYPMPFSEPR
jgi:hypothetical protein